MKAMSNVDIYASVYELNELLVNSRVDKSFQPDKNTVVMRFNVKGMGRVDLVLESGIRIHKTQYPIENPTIPPSFPMLLRKRLKGAHVRSIKQHNFDRVVEIKMEKEQNYTLIVELFAKGNIILLDEQNQIIMPLKRKHWSDRDISSKKEYKFPTSHGINPFEIKIDELKELFNESEDDLVRTLAKNGLGKVYSEEIVMNSKIEKTKLTRDLTNEEVAIIFNSINTIFNPLKELKFTPNIVLNNKDNDNNNNDNGDNDKNNNDTNNNKNINKNNNDINKNKNEIAANGKDVVPFNLKYYENYKKEYFNSFNEACDEFFSSKVNTQIKAIKENVWNKKVNKYAKRLEHQEKTLKDFENTIINSNKKGELLYTNYIQVENILKTISTGREKEYGWLEIAKTLKKAKKDGLKDLQIFESMDKLGNIVLDIDNIKIAMDSKKSIEENAEGFYEKAKKAKRKIKGALIAIENTKKQLAEMESKRDIEIEKISTPTKRVKKDLKWYEKLRWFLSSDKTLVIGGRDANSNEDVVKKYLDNNDIYLHSDIHGAPSVAVKLDGGEVNDQLLKESAIFAASYSSAWANNYGSQDVYWVKPEQVSKTPESGEFLNKGSFVVRGKRNHIRGAELKIAVGIIDYNGERIMAGPVDAIKTYTNNYVTIRPGYEKKEKIAKEILHRINKNNLITLDDVVRVLPSGKCEIIKDKSK
ncbi:MAG: NFACT family protein [Methanobrevibacter sp.]|jgi:predicted ribosome quality control (RQC) complex YloA/Tae2 family protein|nr:NFACT family protein [Candidatus Methanoflexus mossambicus]